MTTYSRKNRNKNFDRITLLTVLFFVLAGLVVARLFYLQIIKHNYYLAWAEERHVEQEEIKPPRGEIFVWDKNELQPVASNKQFYLMYGVPVNISNATATLAQIEKVIPLTDEERWQAYLRLNQPDDPYEPIRHYITVAQKEKLEELFADDEFERIGFQKEIKRIYPQNNLYADVLGFLGYQGDERVG